MRKIFILLVSISVFVSCKQKTEKSSEQIELQEINQFEEPIGGDTDEHGCLPAAGQTWSELKQDCVQLFEVGERLNPLEKKPNKATISAFVIHNDDASKVELFLPDMKETIILNSSANGIYEYEVYRFDNHQKVLSINGKDVFKGE